MLLLQFRVICLVHYENAVKELASFSLPAFEVGHYIAALRMALSFKM
jgi:hypothetical protein